MLSEQQLLQVFQLVIGFIVGVRVFLRMNRERLSLFDPKTRLASIEVVSSEVACALVVTVLFF